MVLTRALRPILAKKASGPVLTMVLANSKNSSCRMQPSRASPPQEAGLATTSCSYGHGPQSGRNIPLSTFCEEGRLHEQHVRLGSCSAVQALTTSRLPDLFTSNSSNAACKAMECQRELRVHELVKLRTLL